MVGRGEAYPPVGREGCCRCECSSIAEGSRIECGEPWGRSHPSEREWERTKVAEPHGTGIPCRDQADQEAEDVRRIFNGSEIFPRVLPEDVFGRHRPQRLAEVLSIPAGREKAIAQERVQQVREHKAQGVRGLVGKNDWPRFVEEEPEVYEREELEKLFAVCDKEERLWYEFFLMTGMREQEVMHCSWADVNLTRSTVTVRYKPEYGFSPKNYREREIPIPAKLVTSLKAWKAKAEKFCGLVFPTAGCSPKLNFLDDLKVVVERANLDKENFWLHKFRATFATWHLWNSVDLRTVQMWLGHSDMESTMRYLKPSRSQAVRDRVDSTFGGEQ